MKINAIAKLAKETENISLLDAPGRQHIVIRTALFPLDGLPPLTEETVLAVLDVPVGNRVDYTVTRSDAGKFADYITDNTDGDREAKLTDVLISIGGETVRPVYTPYGMVCIREADRKPITDSEKTAEYFVRLHDNKPIVVVKNGFQLIAAFLPCTGWAAKEEDCEVLRDLADYAGKLNGERKKQAETSSSPDSE